MNLPLFLVSSTLLPLPSTKQICPYIFCTPPAPSYPPWLCAVSIHGTLCLNRTFVWLLPQITPTLHTCTCPTHLPLPHTPAPAPCTCTSPPPICWHLHHQHLHPLPFVLILYLYPGSSLYQAQHIEFVREQRELAEKQLSRQYLRTWDTHFQKHTTSRSRSPSKHTS